MKFFDMTVPLNYNPILLGEERPKEKGWWVVGETPPELGKYLRTLYKFSTYSCSLLIRPAWADHITIVRDEKPTITEDKVKSFWRKYIGQSIECRVILEPETNGYYWWLPIISEAACVLRRELGLTPSPEIPLHLSFGHTGVKNESK